MSKILVFDLKKTKGREGGRDGEGKKGKEGRMEGRKEEGRKGRKEGERENGASFVGTIVTGHPLRLFPFNSYLGCFLKWGPPSQHPLLCKRLSMPLHEWEHLGHSADSCVVRGDFV